MTTVVSLLFVLGVLGAFDTLYYHEWRARLPALGRTAAPELKLHAVRDFFYAFLFAALPNLAFNGLFVVPLALVLLAEIGITLRDFVVEDWVRKPLGGVFPGERVTHAVMGIIYGAILAYLIPELSRSMRLASGLGGLSPAVPDALRAAMLVMSAGVFGSGVRDLCAAYEVRGAAWPWKR
jgi:hypothetical protein